MNPASLPKPPPPKSTWNTAESRIIFGPPQTNLNRGTALYHEGKVYIVRALIYKTPTGLKPELYAVGLFCINNKKRFVKEVADVRRQIEDSTLTYAWMHNEDIGSVRIVVTEQYLIMETIDQENEAVEGGDYTEKANKLL